MRFLVIIFAIFSKSVCGQEGRKIVNDYLKIVSDGNIDNWNKVKSIYKESEAYYSQSDFEQRINLTNPDKSNFHKTFLVLPYKHKVEIYDDSSFTKPTSTFYFLEKRTVILLNNIPPIIKEPPVRDQFYSVHLPVKISKLLNKSNSVEFLGIKKFASEGLSCYEVRMLTMGRFYTLFINTETSMLEYWNDREDGDTSVLTKLYNYKKVEGLFIPMSESLVRNGSIYFWENTKKYLVNSNINNEIFNYKDK